MRRLPLSMLLTALMALPVVATEFAVQDGTPEGDLTALSPEMGDDLSLGECCCDCCCPSWTGRVGYVYWWRERTGSDFNVLEVSPAGDPIFTADQFDFDGQSGVDVSVGHDNGCGQGFEVRYLGVEEFVSVDNVIIASDTTFVSPATNPQSTSVPGGGSWDVGYESELQSLELVVYRNSCGYCVSYGFRYASLDERLQLLSSQNDNYGFATENDLYGFQLGLATTLWQNDCRLRVDADTKVGIYLNQADAASSAGGIIDTSGGRNDETSAAFLGELGLNAVYDVSCCLSLRAGYQLLFVDGVALAADQVPNTGNLARGSLNVPVTVDTSSLLYHGLNVGLEFRR